VSSSAPDDSSTPAVPAQPAGASASPPGDQGPPLRTKLETPAETPLDATADDELPEPEMAATPHPTRRVKWAEMGLTLAIGLGGGLLFDWLHLPLAYMLGAMTACLVACLFGAPLRAPEPLGDPVRGVLGVMLGAAFSPEMADRVGQLATTLGLLVPFVVLITIVGLPYLRMAARTDTKTAYFAVMPGGLYSMVYMTQLARGDDRFVSTMHGTRVLLLVFAAPFVVSWVTGTALGPRPASTATLSDLGFLDIGILTLCAVFGILTGRLFRNWGGILIMPMGLSALVHITGVTAAAVPAEVVILAQWVVGSLIGARYRGLGLWVFAKSMLVSLGLFFVLSTVTALFAYGIGPLIGVDPLAMMLAYAPGGLAEMSLIALALNLDAASVALHHAIRILLIVILAPMVYRLLGGKLARQAKTAAPD